MAVTEKGKILNFESIIVSSIYELGGGVTVKQILKNTGLAKKHENKVKETIKKLIRSRVLFKNKKEQLYISEMRNVYTGKVATLSRNFGFVTNLLTEEDSFVSGGQLKGAVPGDIVLAKEVAEKTSTRSATAVVIAVLQHSEELFGGVIVRERQAFRVLPDTLGCPPLAIVKVSEMVKEGDKVLFSIRKRGEHHSEHTVDVVKVLGSCEYAKNCTDAYLIQNGIPVVFSPECSAMAKEIGTKEISQKDIAKRLDLRDTPIFTIDGADTKDIDDAISVEKTDSGYKLGVHIADVSHYVTKDSAIDVDALERGTSVYIADKVIPMLPKELSNGICSLNPGVDRLAFSCLMEISKEGKLGKFQFKKTVIRSRLQGVYSEVNAILENTADDSIKEKYREVIDIIPVMKELADILSRNKSNRGAPDIQSSESKIICDKDGICIDVKKRVQGISEGIIEEFMLMANNAAARLAMKHELPFVYRIHENPTAEKIETLKMTLDGLGINALHINENSSAADFSALLRKTEDDPRYPIINRLILRTMAKAKYSEKPVGHFGLVMAEYAHFTSPIRRYSDLAIHRILTDYVSRKGAENIKKIYSDFAVRASAIATKTELSAVAAERSCEDFYTAEYMENHIDEEFDGIISGVLNSGFFVELPNTVEGKVDVMTLPAGDYETRNNIALLETLSHTAYTIGDRVRVKCVNANVNSGQIDFELIKVYNNEN